MKTVIIGNGCNAVSVATKLRRCDENAEIVILSPSQEFAVAKCGLHYLLDGTVSDKSDLLAVTPEQLWRLFKIKVKLRANIIEINRIDKFIQIENKYSESYDKLVIASDATIIRPDIKGILGENIFVASTLQAMERIKSYFFENNVKKVLVLGFSNTALSLAEAFYKLGAKVTLTDNNSHILPEFDADMTDALEKNICNELNINILFNSRISAFDTNAVHFENGISLGFDMAVIATPAVIDVKLPILANLELGKDGGISVNKYMQSNDSDIYVCGDYSEMQNLITSKYERIDSPAFATKQARTIANHICGISMPIKGFKTCKITRIFNKTIGISGATEQELVNADIKYKKVYLHQFNSDLYIPKASPMLLKLLFNDSGKILGMQIIGENGVAERINAVSVQIQHNADVNDLIFEDIAHYPEFSQVKDALNNIGAIAEEVRTGRLNYMVSDNLDNDVFLIDVRTPEDFKEDALPNAINLPLAAIRDNLDIIPHNRKIALYCNRGYGAYIAYQILKQTGFDDLYLLWR
ncbi:MAG: hypothetical protein E7012_06705 [Alphaproteobacteria bacterium]|nr:hypothetical protein [Alphaproteobacteria bacterium]